MKKRTSLFENGLIWFGAAVSIAEILTGTYLAPLGFAKGMGAILLGHVIGCVLLFLAGLIGGTMRKSAMETTKSSFGKQGALLFVVLNIVQLVGWTAIMIYDGSMAANEIFAWGISIWSILIGGLIAIWILVGIQNLGKLNTIAMSALFALTLLLCYVIFGKGIPSPSVGEALSFGAAVELSVAMPLSWLPLISDYTREAEKPLQATAVSAIVYGLVSSWMYLIGMIAAMLTGESDIAQIMVKAGLGVAGLFIVVFSTVTTTFLDAYSAGISAESLSAKIPGKGTALIVSGIGILGAIFLPLENITDFLYFIGSVFAPMIAIQIADFFLLKKNHEDQTFCLENLIVWLVGFLVYRLLMQVDIPIGNTLPDMAITMALCWIVWNVRRKK